MFKESFDREAFSKRLQSKLHVLRASMEASQVNVANALGLARSTYVNCENGTKEIPWEKCLALLFFFESNPQSHEMLRVLNLLPIQQEQKP